MIEWTPEKRSLLARTVCKGLSQDEVEVFVHLCERHGLDPFAKEIWAVAYQGGAPAFFVSRDGYNALAHRSGQFDGMHSTTTDDDKGFPVSATAEVWRKDMSHSFRFTAKMKEYQQRSPIWSRYPSAMLIKVAESMALKRAFSASGLVSIDEVEDPGIDNRVHESVEAPPPPPPPAPPEKKKVAKIAQITRKTLALQLVSRGLTDEAAAGHIARWQEIAGEKPSVHERRKFAEAIESGDFDPIAGEIEIDDTPAPQAPAGPYLPTSQHASWGILVGALAEAQGADRSQADSLLVAWFKPQGVEAAAISLSELNKLYSGAISAIDDGTIK